MKKKVMTRRDFIKAASVAPLAGALIPAFNGQPAQAAAEKVKVVLMFTPNPSAWHSDTCADLAKIWDLPHVKGRTRLNVLVMLTPLFHAIGPHNYSK
ncbi:MAG: twin-arginine translocation signal domain-containing protein, partial [Candidatus Aminicenantes bacterium]|nr:twin-arginine translocation signal domain-containing protein [Candidatus Aminicenantes bacterium]